MKKTIGEAVDAHDSLVAIQKANEIPVVLAWQFGDWLAELAPIARRFIEQQEMLAKKFGKADPKNATQFFIDPSKILAFTGERDKLRAIEVDLNGQTKLKLDELTENGIKIPPAADLIAMRLFIQ